MKKLLILLFIFLNGFIIQAMDSTETGVSTSPLAIYSGGISIGALAPLNTELKNESSGFFELAFINDIYITSCVHLFINADWHAPGANFGANAGANWMFSKSSFRPFIGLGIGARYFDKIGNTFGENFGPEGTIHAGFLLEVTEAIQFQVQVPYYLTLNNAKDQELGVEIGLLFSKPYRHTKKLNY